jgi:hypothetical protein
VRVAIIGIAPPKPSFAELLTQLWKDQHTGPVIIHFAQGTPNAVELPAEPTRIKLEAGK